MANKHLFLLVSLSSIILASDGDHSSFVAKVMNKINRIGTQGTKALRRLDSAKQLAVQEVAVAEKEGRDPHPLADRIILIPTNNTHHMWEGIQACKLAYQSGNQT